MRLSGFLLLLAAFNIFILGCSRNNEGYETYEKGVDAFQSLDYEMAADNLANVKKTIRRQHPEFYYYLGKSYYELNKPSPAKRNLLNYLKYTDILKFHDAYYLIGDIEKKNPDICLSYMRKFIESSTHRLLPETFSAFGIYTAITFTDIAEDFQKAIDAYYKTFVVENIDYNRKFEECISLLNKCIKKQPGFIPAYYFIAMIYSNISSKKFYSFEKTGNMLNRAVEEIEKNESDVLYKDMIYFKLAELYYPKKPEKCKEYLQNSLSINKNNYNSRYLLGLVFRDMKKYSKAVNEFVITAENCPNNYLGFKSIKRIRELSIKGINIPRDAGGLVETLNIRDNPGKTEDVFIYGKVKNGLELKGIKTMNYTELLTLKEGRVKNSDLYSKLNNILNRLIENNKPEKDYGLMIINTKEHGCCTITDNNHAIIFFEENLIKKIINNLNITDEDSIIAFILGHEMAHSEQDHVLGCSSLFRNLKEAEKTGDIYYGIKDNRAKMILIKERRRHEIEADERGIRYAFIAGYDPNGAIDAMRILAAEYGQIGLGKNYPTYLERVEYLWDYWMHEVRFQYEAVKQGVTALDNNQFENAIKQFSLVRDFFAKGSYEHLDLSCNIAISYYRKAGGDKLEYLPSLPVIKGIKKEFILLKKKKSIKLRGPGGGGVKTVPSIDLEMLDKAERVLLSEIDHYKKNTLLGLINDVMGTISVRIDRRNEAEIYHRKAITSHGLEKTYAINNYGIHLCLKKEFDKGIMQFDTIKNNYPDAWFNLGVAYYKSDKYDQAKNAFNNYITKVPKGRMVVKAKEYLNRLAQTP